MATISCAIVERELAEEGHVYPRNVEITLVVETMAPGPDPRGAIPGAPWVLVPEEAPCIACEGGRVEILELSVDIGGGPRSERRVVPVEP